MKRKIIILFFLSYMSTILLGQQLPHYSLYMLNEVIVNPAALSKEESNKITFMIRDQWGGFPGAPATQSISYNHLNHIKYKRGVSVMNDVAGPISILNATLSASYSIPLQNQNRFALGASGTFMQYSVDNSQIVLATSNIDPAVLAGVDRTTGSSIAIGTYYYHPNYFIGLSIPHIFGSSLNVSGNRNSNRLSDHYYVNSGINIYLKSGNKIVPSLMFKKIDGMPIQLDLNLRGIYQNFIWAGLSYRSQDAVVALVGLDYNQSSLGYSYDVTTSAVRLPSSGSHGLVYSYKFKKKVKDKDKDGVLDEEDECPTIPGLVSLKGCPDKDGDGIIDSKDECPERFGLLINNGCPDMDSDGVIDRNDTCPEIPGLAKFDGCPDTDGDGLQDKLDDCPEEYGPIINRGCPKSPGKDTVYIIKYRTDTVYLTANEQREFVSLQQKFANIQFEFNKHTLLRSSEIILDEAYIYLQRKSGLMIELIGHTDDVADDDYNMTLSKKRVKSVQRYLVKKGISKSRIKISWKGESEPLINSKTSEARAKNRRVELKIMNE